MLSGATAQGVVWGPQGTCAACFPPHLRYLSACGCDWWTYTSGVTARSQGYGAVPSVGHVQYTEITSGLNYLYENLLWEIPQNFLVTTFCCKLNMYFQIVYG